MTDKEAIELMSDAIYDAHVYRKPEYSEDTDYEGDKEALTHLTKLVEERDTLKHEVERRSDGKENT